MTSRAPRAKFNAGNLPEPAEIAMIPLRKIMRDRRVNTREIDEAWITKRLERFDENGMGTLAVSFRADGDYIVLDGQHRAELKRRVKGDVAEVRCQVFRDLTLAQEAELFGILNDSRALTSLAKFLARLTEQEPVAMEIAAIAERCSFRIADSPSPGVLKCVATLEHIYTHDKAKKLGAKPMDLERTLLCVTHAWAHSAGTSDRGLIGGIGAMFNTYEESIDPEGLTKLLSVYDGGPSKLLSDARGLRSFRGGSITNSVAELVVKEYNKAFKHRKLPAWRK